MAFWSFCEITMAFWSFSLISIWTWQVSWLYLKFSLDYFLKTFDPKVCKYLGFKILEPLQGNFSKLVLLSINMNAGRKRPPDTYPQQHVGPQAMPRTRKKPTDKTLPKLMEEQRPEDAKLYTQLREAETRVDATILRKRFDLKLLPMSSDCLLGVRNETTGRGAPGASASLGARA